MSSSSLQSTNAEESNPPGVTTAWMKRPKRSTWAVCRNSFVAEVIIFHSSSALASSARFLSIPILSLFRFASVAAASASALALPASSTTVIVFSAFFLLVFLLVTCSALLRTSSKREWCVLVSIYQDFTKKMTSGMSSNDGRSAPLSPLFFA